MFVVPAEIGARCALTAELAVRLQRQILHPLRDLGGDIGGADMFGEALGIFGGIVVEARTDAPFGDGERLVAEHRNRPLQALYQGVGEQSRSIGRRVRYGWGRTCKSR